MSFESGAIKSIQANHSYLKKGSNVFDREKLGPSKQQMNWTGRRTANGQKPYRLATQPDWPPYIKMLLKWFSIKHT